MPLHLTRVAIRDDASRPNVFPFNTAVVRSLEPITLTSPVTFFVGANGSGKSTLLEGIATAAGLPTVGAEETVDDVTLEPQRTLGDALRLAWTARTRRGFYLRAEDFFGFAKRMSRMKDDVVERIREIEVEFRDASDWSRGLALGPSRASLAAMQSLYGEGLDARSHGESFLQLFRSRFVPKGLYLLDEPEAPLSPQSQLALLAMLHDMVAENAQFIIATHSPILLAFPGATIFSFDRTPPGPVEYDELEHVNLTRDFLTNPGRFLRHLTTDSSDAR